MSKLLVRVVLGIDDETLFGPDCNLEILDKAASVESYKALVKRVIDAELCNEEIEDLDITFIKDGEQPMIRVRTTDWGRLFDLEERIRYAIQLAWEDFDWVVYSGSPEEACRKLECELLDKEMGHIAYMKVPGRDEEGIDVVLLSGTTIAFRFSAAPGWANGQWEIGKCDDAAQLWADCRHENLWKAAVQDESSMVEEA